MLQITIQAAIFFSKIVPIQTRWMWWNICTLWCRVQVINGVRIVCQTDKEAMMRRGLTPWGKPLFGISR